MCVSGTSVPNRKECAQEPAGRATFFLLPCNSRQASSGLAGAALGTSPLTALLSQHQRVGAHRQFVTWIFLKS